MAGNKRKNKSYYANAAKRARQSGQGKVLAENMKGFLLTCNNREKEAVREAYNLFNEYADKLIGPEHMQSKDTEEAEDTGSEDDIDAALEKEKESLAKIEKSKERRFQVVESGANSCIFIKTYIQDPSLIVNSLIEDIYEKKESKARYIFRLIPIIGTCKAYDKNMTEMAEKLLKEYFGSGSPTYSVLFKLRNNNQVKRDDTINLFAKVVRELNSECKVDFKNPDLCITVEIIRNVCCLGVVKEFYKYKKYNLVELAKKEDEANDENPADDKENEQKAESNGDKKVESNGETKVEKPIDESDTQKLVDDENDCKENGAKDSDESKEIAEKMKEVESCDSTQKKDILDDVPAKDTSDTGENVS